MFKLKEGDEIVVTIGKDKGKKGKIEKVLKGENKIVVPAINIYKRHRKATASQKSGVFEFPRPMRTANVALICPKCSKQTRVGFEIEGKKKYRVCKKCHGRLSS